MKVRLDALTAELANAIAACEKSPLVPLCFEQLGNAGDHARDLRSEVQSIKNDLPLFLLKSSAAELSELTARLKTCAEFSQKAAQLGSEIQSALRLISEFDQQVLDLGAHANAMADEAEFG
jgi:hypothetical protein